MLFQEPIGSSQKPLQNDSSIAIIGADTAENVPKKGPKMESSKDINGDTTFFGTGCGNYYICTVVGGVAVRAGEKIETWPRVFMMIRFPKLYSRLSHFLLVGEGELTFGRVARAQSLSRDSGL